MVHCLERAGQWYIVWRALPEWYIVSGLPGLWGSGPRVVNCPEFLASGTLSGKGLLESTLTRVDGLALTRLAGP